MQKTVYTTCARDCWDACGIVARVEGGRLVALEGDSGHPVTKGFLCAKMRRDYLKRVYSPERVLHPMLKRGGSWKRISWDEALAVAAEKLARCRDAYGPLSILFYQGFGHMGILLRFLSRRFFNLLGGVTETSGSLCDSAGEEGLNLSFGSYRSHDPADTVNSGTVFIWGRNPASTNIHLLPFIMEARRRGAKLAVVDPVRSRTAALADLHLAPRPGSDSYLALAMARVICEERLVDHPFLEERTSGLEGFLSLCLRHSLDDLARRCGITSAEIRRAALLYGRQKPSSILLGMGGQHYRGGAETYRLISALPALTGQIGIPGGGVSFEFSTAAHFDRALEGDSFASRRRHVPKPLIGKELRTLGDPSLRMAWVTAANPVNNSPDPKSVREAFESLEFVVVQDAFMTDTADCAHLFLPSCLFLELTDVTAGYGHCCVGPVNPAAPPPGEARPDLEVFQSLAWMLGFGAEMEGEPGLWIERAARPLIEAGVRMADLNAGPCRDPGVPSVPYMDGRFPTASGKYEFIESLDAPFERGLFPPALDAGSRLFHLITPKAHDVLLADTLQSDQGGAATVLVHPARADSLGIGDGERALLESSTGAMEVEVALDPGLREDTLCLANGGWVKCGRGANILVAAVMSNRGQGAGYYDTVVELKPLYNGRGTR